MINALPSSVSQSSGSFSNKSCAIVCPVYGRDRAVSHKARIPRTKPEIRTGFSIRRDVVRLVETLRTGCAFRIWSRGGS